MTSSRLTTSHLTSTVMMNDSLKVFLEALLMAIPVSAPTPTLPLAARDFLILLALVEGRGHGYAILQNIAEESDGAVRMDPANLYRSLRRLAREGLVQEHDPDETRRRQYELTATGIDVVASEAVRLERLVNVARNKSLLPATGGKL